MLEVMRSKALLPLIDRRALVFLKKHLVFIVIEMMF